MALYYEPGTYICEVTDQALTESKSGKPMIVFRVRPQFLVRNDGMDDEDHEPVPANAYDRKCHIVVGSEDQINYAIKKLRYAGWKGTRFEDLNMVGRQVKATCEEGEYNGEPSEQWDLALPRLQSEPLEHKPELAKKLNALFGKRLKDVPAETAVENEPEPQEQPASVPPDDSDIPF